MPGATALPWRIPGPARIPGWALTQGSGGSAGVGQAYPSRRRISVVLTAKVRGRCLTCRRPLTTRAPRRLGRASVSVARRAGLRGGIVICATHRLAPATTNAAAGPSACVRLSPSKTDACRWLTRWVRRVPMLRRHRTSGIPAPRLLTGLLTGGFRASTARPMVPCLSLTGTSSRDASMRHSTRSATSARATRPG